MSESSHVSEAPERRRIWDEPRNVRRLIWSFFVTAGLVFLLDAVFFFSHKHAAFEDGSLPQETWFGFYSVYGFVSCVLLVVLAKQMRRVLKRDENYYGTSATYDPSGIRTGEPDFRHLPVGHSMISDHDEVDGSPGSGPGHDKGVADR